MISRNRIRSPFFATGAVLLAAAVASATPTVAQEPCFPNRGYRADQPLDLLREPLDRDNACMTALRDGLSAVRLPKAGENINDVAAANGLSEHRWGFIDADGKLAIPPRFAAVGSFHDGRAKASPDGTVWGYIDKNGDWAVKPAFTEAGDFSDNGLASVKADGSWTIIDRDGTDLDVPLGDQVENVHIGRGDPAVTHVAYDFVTKRADGTTIAVPEGMNLVKRFGDSDLFVARRKGGEGLVDRDLEWVLEPRFDSIEQPRTSGGLALGLKDYLGQSLIRPDGTLVGESFDRVRQLTDAHWLVLEDSGTFAMLDRTGKTLATFNRSEIAGVHRDGGFVVYSAKDKTRIFAPRVAKPVVLDENQSAGRALVDGVLPIKSGDAIVGLVTVTGRMQSADASDQNWVGDIARAEFKGAFVWMRDRDGALLNVLDPDGRAILDAQAVKTLANHRLRALNEKPANDGKPVAIALIGENHCHCDDNGAGLLLSDGMVLVNEDWQEVSPLDTQRAGEGGKARFSVQTVDGIGMMDAAGTMLLEPTQEHIGTFHHGDAFIYADGHSSIIDRDGKRYDMPSGFGMAVVAPELVSYQTTAAADELLSLYDLSRGEAVTEPKFSRIGDFVGDTAVARDAKGKAGVIDRGGAWILKPRYEKIERVTDTLWAVRKARPEKRFADVPTAIVTADGETVVPYSDHLSTELWEDGRVAVRTSEAGRGHLLLSASGQMEVDAARASFTRVGDWLQIKRKSATGYLDDGGEWQLALQPGFGDPMHEASGHALFTEDGEARIIDGTGETVATLPEGEWVWRAGTDWTVGRPRTGGRTKTAYTDANGKTVLTVDGRASAFQGAHALHEASRDTRPLWIDRSGKKTDPGRYDALGLPAGNGLAFARDGRFGFIDGEGKYVIPPVYGFASNFTDGRAVVSSEDSAMMIDADGQPVARVTTVCGVRVLYGPDNRREYPGALPNRCAR